jgi:hypothetical protein
LALLYISIKIDIYLNLFCFKNLISLVNIYNVTTDQIESQTGHIEGENNGCKDNIKEIQEKE